MFLCCIALPIRISNLGVNTVKKMRTTQLGLKGLLGSRDHLFCNLFPAMCGEKGLTINKSASSRQKTFRFFSGMKNGSLFKQLIHEEIRQKIHILEYFKTQQASRLGLMIKLSPFMTASEEKDILNTVSTQSNQCLLMMKRIMDPLKSSTQGEFDVKSTIQHMSSASEPSLQPEDIAKGLLEVIDDWNACQENIVSLKNIYGPPSLLTRYWIPGIIGYFAGTAVVQIITERQEDIINWFSELGVTAKDFLVNWIWEPVLQVWDTIRLKDERLSVLGKESLVSDLEVSGRMALE